MLAAFVFMSLGSIMAEDSPSDAIERIGAGIANLRAEFPQLNSFSVSQHVHAERWEIEYGYHTHRVWNRAGWVGGVPNPDDDGVWFFIDFHRPDSQRQIDRQPVVPPYCFGEEQVLFLILQGKNTKSVADAVWQVLEQQGVKYCPEGVVAAEVKPSDAIERVGADIAKFKGKFPQLGQFSISQHVHPERLTIEYDYRTHDPRPMDGLSAPVPEPYDDGVWLYISFQEPDPALPVNRVNNPVRLYCFGEKHVFVVILQGKKNQSVLETVGYFLEQQGVKDCPAASR
jgi:hypothetical protein